MADCSDDGSLSFEAKTSSTTTITPNSNAPPRVERSSYFKYRDTAIMTGNASSQRTDASTTVKPNDSLESAWNLSINSTAHDDNHRTPSLVVPMHPPSQGRWSDVLPSQDNNGSLSSSGPPQRATSLHEAQGVRPLKSRASKLSMNEEYIASADQSGDKKHEGRKGGKKGFLERIGLRKNKRHEDEQQQHPVDKHINNIEDNYDDDDYEQEEEEDTEEEGEEEEDTDYTAGSSMSSSTAARNSIDSVQSVPQPPGSSGIHRDGSRTFPHKGIPVKVKSKGKGNVQEWPPLYLAQTLTVLPRAPPVDRSRRPSHDAQEHQLNHSHPYGATWTMKFSKDGKFMASAGQFCNIYLWKVLDETSPVGADGTTDVFEDAPHREYRGHLADVLDISWSKNNFIVSASMDKTVRLWHVSQEECLGVFPHLDIVTSVAFHPKDDRFFLSGALDSRLRLWNAPEKKVAFWNELQNGSMITAVGFTLDGKTACAGTHIGQCFFYETQGLKYNTQINIRFNKRISKKGRKITGIEPMPATMPGDERMLITSNDSRSRLYNMRDKSLMFRYKGPHNLSMQIRASFSDDGRNIVCGSEDGHVYIMRTLPTTHSPLHNWPGAEMALSQFEANEEHLVVNNNTQTASSSPRVASWLKRSERRGNQDKLRIHSEYFEAHQHTATVAVFAPTRTRQTLARTGHDIIYNNTPIEPDDPRQREHRNKTTTTTVMHNDTTIMRRSFSGGDEVLYHDEQIVATFQEEEELERKEIRENYRFPTGHIIVSANDTGCIKVWRMDSGVYDNASICSPQQHQARKGPTVRHRRSSSLDMLIQQQQHQQGSTKSTVDSSSKSTGRRHHLGHLFSSVGRHNKS